MTDENLMQTDETVEDHTTDPVPAETEEESQGAHTPDEQPEGETDTEDDAELADVTKAGREAAKYRRRLRETEAERDSLTEQVDSLRRSVAEQIAVTSGMSNPEALWIGDASVEDMLDADGNVDRDRVLAACDDVAGRFGIRRRPRPNPAQLETPEDAPRSVTDQMVSVVQGRR